jgi:hypothetical protein
MNPPITNQHSQTTEESTPERSAGYLLPRYVAQPGDCVGEQETLGANPLLASARR